MSQAKTRIKNATYLLFQYFKMINSTRITFNSFLVPKNLKEQSIG